MSDELIGSMFFMGCITTAILYGMYLWGVWGQELNKTK